MDKIEYKKKVLQEARERQKEIIEDFRTRINEIKSSEVQVNEEPMDYDQQGHDEEGTITISRLADQLNFAVDEIDLLDKLRTDENILDKVTLGSIVKTNKATFFPSVSLERFRVDGEELLGLSDKAPLYQAMKGKKKGDTFRFKDTEYKILDVF